MDYAVEVPGTDCERPAVTVGRTLWRRHPPAWEPPEGATVHARADADADGPTVCEAGGGPVAPDGSVAVDLGHPQASWGDVTCPACLEWRHA